MNYCESDPAHQCWCLTNSHIIKEQYPQSKCYTSCERRNNWKQFLLQLLVCDLNRTPIIMAKHGGSCVNFSGISTCGRTSRQTVSHPTLYKISLPVCVIVTNKRLPHLTTTRYNSPVLSFSWIGALRQQAIMWANVDPDLRRHMVSLGHNDVTRLPLVPHICVTECLSIGSDNGLSPIRRQAIIWTNAGLLSIEPLGTNFSEILSKRQNFSFTEIHLKISPAKWRPFYPGGDELINFLSFSQHCFLSHFALHYPQPAIVELR